MSIHMPQGMALPEPRTHDMGSPRVTDYLVQLNQSLQTEHEQVRRTFKSGMQSGTLILDDGANWRLTVVLEEGRVSSITTAASSAATATWTAA